ncbi:MAG: Transglutaminase-like superfamily protein [Firmicutes bacterium ADurb.Bin419]|nr:MAG: Transglutaminase-like superfamily protein [Firmicutes bacterium ADurb.Bin419]
MNKKNPNIKNNLIKLVMFLSLVLLSAFLLMAAINMLNLPNEGLGGGEDKNKNSSEEKNNPPKVSSGTNDNTSDFDDWQDRVRKRRAERKGSTVPGEKYSYGEGQEGGNYGEGEYPIPENVPNIDISGDNDIPDIPFGRGENGQTIVMSNEKQPHTAAFEVLGYPNYPFLKVMVMDYYRNNRWTVAEEEPEVKINFDKELDENYSANSVKIKPIVPSNGYLPVLSGNIDFKYSTSVKWYKSSETYYSDDPVSNSYEMDYETPAEIEQLAFSKTDDSYAYTIYVPDDIESFVDNIIANCNSDYDLIKAIEDYLRINYVLSNETINNYGVNDGISTFLENKGGKGNTLDFMSAYAYLLKAVGIPCRLAIGYRINPDLPYQVVYSDQTYIYPEIKFEEYGWVPMDVFGYDPLYTPPYETTTEITYASVEAKRGTSFTVKGTVKDANGTMLDNMSVLIYVKQSKSENTLSYVKADVKNGYFEVDCDIKYSTGAGKYQVVAELLENDLYRTSTSDPEMKVTTDTFIELDADDTVFGSSFKVTGRLLDGYSKEGIMGQILSVDFQDEVDQISFLSGENGKFSQVIEVKNFRKLSPEKDFFFVKSYNIFYIMNFEGTDLFFPSSKEGSIYVWQVLWLRIVLAIAVLFIIVGVPGCVYYFRKRRVAVLENANVLLAVDGILQKPEVHFSNPITLKESNPQIIIGFPQIKNGYPDVWGVNEEFLIRFGDYQQNGDEIKNHFHKKGVYRIWVSDGIGKITKRDIRIVDYREEIILNGKKLLKELSVIIDISDKMTLREILELARAKLSVMKFFVLEQVFATLEKAVYSLNDITRDDYELFYMCLQKYSNQV